MWRISVSRLAVDRTPRAWANLRALGGHRERLRSGAILAIRSLTMTCGLLLMTTTPIARPPALDAPVLLAGTALRGMGCSPTRLRQQGRTVGRRRSRTDGRYLPAKGTRPFANGGKSQNRVSDNGLLASGVLQVCGAKLVVTVLTNAKSPLWREAESAGPIAGGV